MEYNLKIIRSKRKSVLISVSTQNEVTVRCPLKMSETRLREFIGSKKAWLEQIFADNLAKNSVNKSILTYREVYVCGIKKPLIFSDKNLITQNAVYIKSINNIKNTFISHFSDNFILQVQILSNQLNLPVKDCSIKAYKRRWGCCDSKGAVTFNYLLFMLPAELQRYVIIHELCHTVYFNHSPLFWRLVAKFEPDYKNLRKQLKYFDFITKLY